MGHVRGEEGGAGGGWGTTGGHLGARWKPTREAVSVGGRTVGHSRPAQVLGQAGTGLSAQLIGQQRGCRGRPR
jgi:hypothetical protein